MMPLRMPSLMTAVPHFQKRAASVVVINRSGSYGRAIVLSLLPSRDYHHVFSRPQSFRAPCLFSYSRPPGYLDRVPKRRSLLAFSLPGRPGHLFRRDGTPVFEAPARAVRDGLAAGGEASTLL